MMTKIMAFDLSSSCIGVVAALLDERKNILTVKSTPIIPKPFDPSVLGYMKSKKNLPTSKGVKVNTYWRKGERSLSEAEKRHRDAEVRHAKNNFVLAEIGGQINTLVQGVNPDVILAEQNKIFNGILTSVLLGEVMGVLEGVAATYAVPVIKYTVEQVRRPHNASRLVAEFAKTRTAEELQALPDVTKAAFRRKMEEEYGRYGFEPQTDDEGDACVVFDYYYNTVIKPF